MLRSQTTQPVRSSVKKTSLSASSTGGRRASQCSPPSRVSSRAPLPPTAQPRPPPTKKTECSQANDPVRCFDQAAFAEGKRQKAESRSRRQEQTAGADGGRQTADGRRRRVAARRNFKFEVLTLKLFLTQTASCRLLLPSASCPLESAREDAREAE